MNHKQDSELSFFAFSFNDLFYTLNAIRYTLEMYRPEVFLTEFENSIAYS